MSTPTSPSLFGTIGTLLNAVTSIVNSVVGITASIDNVVASTNSCTSAMAITAKELEDDTKFTCTKKQDVRDAAVLKYKAELADL